MAGWTVLVLEDDKSFRRLLEHSLQGPDAGHIQLVGAGTLRTALRNLASGHFDAAVLDLGLPDSAGVETIATIRGEHPDLPLVVLTGDDELDPITVLEAGADDFLVKTHLEKHALVRALRFAIVRRRILREELDRHVAAREAHGRNRTRRFMLDFVKEAAHELNTPLTPLALEVRRLNVSKEGSGERLERSVHRLQTVVDGMLNVAALPADLKPEALEDGDLAQLIRRAMRKAGSKEHFLQDAPGGPVRFHMDWMRRALEALFTWVNNSARDAQVRLCWEGGHAVIEITGIDARAGAPDSWFTPFDGRDGTRGGNGGLFVARAVASFHGGFLAWNPSRKALLMSIPRKAQT